MHWDLIANDEARHSAARWAPGADQWFVGTDELRG